MYYNRSINIKKDSDFRKVYKHGKSIANKYLVMYILKNRLKTTRVGISVSKKIGNAVIRNKVRRRIKEVYRLNVDSKIKVGYDIVFIARTTCKDCSMENIKWSIDNLIKRHNLI